MRLQQIELKNINQFKHLKINFTANISNSNNSSNSTQPITVIFGAQGSGKTSVLKHIFYGLSWFAARHKDMRTPGIPIQDIDMLQHSLRAAVDLHIVYPSELGLLDDSADSPDSPDVSSLHCHWTLIKSRPTEKSAALSRPNLAQLEQLVTRYQVRCQQEPQFSTPCFAYYPVERFVHEVNLTSKSASGAQFHLAYDLTPIPFMTFNKFFEWYRESFDLENARAAALLRQFFAPLRQSTLSADMTTSDAPSSTVTFTDFERAYRLLPQRNLDAVNYALNRIFPSVEQIFIDCQSQLSLMVKLTHHTVPYMQLSQMMRTWIALIGDVVRRLCLLNPYSLNPCQDGVGIVLIDEVDMQLDEQHRIGLLPRLQQTFPNIQWIVSALHADIADIADHATDMQILSLVQQQVLEVNFGQHQQDLERLYQQLNQTQPQHRKDDNQS